jgi:hypothetical protein
VMLQTSWPQLDPVAAQMPRDPEPS